MLLYIDINDMCNLKCTTCPRGVRAFPNTSKRMSVETFSKIVEKGRHDGAYQVGLFNWVEPFLIKNLHEYTQIVQGFGLRCEVASTLAPRNIDGLIECLKSVDLLWVTMSGFSQPVYEINHVSGRIDNVFRNLETISAAKADGEISTEILLRFLMFDYNEHEVEKLREYAEMHSFRFEVLLGSGHPTRMKASADRGREISDMLGSFSSSRIYERAGLVCPLIFEHIAVNADGDVYQCSATGYHPPLRIGSYLDLTREEILMRRYNQPFCNSCDWTRRQASDREVELLHQALDSRMGRPITKRVARLSDPDSVLERTREGHQLPKDGLGPQW